MELENHEPYTDKYFLRANEILKQEGLNPVVRAQVFIRQGPGTAHGLEEAVALIERHSRLAEHGGTVAALPDGATYGSKETLLLIEAPVQDIIELETAYLGVITAATTRANDHHGVDLEAARDRMAAVVAAAEGRPVSYFGARHWHWSEDAAIAGAAYAGGATSCSTDIGAAAAGQRGMGTIPHALENVYAWKHGRERAVVEATKAFDRVMPREIPRIALIDYNNREIDDSLATAEALEGRLYGVRVDTPGENVAQGAIADPASADGIAFRRLVGDGIPDRYAFGRGVTVSGVYALRQALDATGHDDVKIILSSGFGDPEKVKAFTDAERALGMKLFDGLGVGGIYESRMATMDIVAVGEDRDHLIPLAKTGREYRPNPRLETKIGGVLYETASAL